MTAVRQAADKPGRHWIEPLRRCSLCTLIRTLKPVGIHQNWPERTVTAVLSRNPPDVCRESGMRYQLAPVGEIHAQIRPVQHPGGDGDP